MTDARFLTKLNEIISLSDKGKTYYLRFVNETLKYYQSQRIVLPSVYNEENASTEYSIQLRSRARELARIALFMQDVFNDVSADTSRSDFLYRNFGYLLQIEDPFFFPEKSDLFYRKFVEALLLVVLKGTTKDAIAEGIGIFSEGVPFEVSQVYLDQVEKLNSILNKSGIILTPDGSVPIVDTSTGTGSGITTLPPNTTLEEYFKQPDKSDTNIFEVKFDIDNRAPGSDLDFIMKGVSNFLTIMKPAHNAVRLAWGLEDRLALQGDCEFIFDLITGEEVAEQIQKDPISGLEITAIDEYIITLEDSTVLIVTDSTVLLDDVGDPEFFSNFSIGDKVTYQSHASEGRYQYVSPLSQIPPALLFTSVGFIRPPLVEEVDDTFILNHEFLLFVKKVKDAQGFDKLSPSTPTAACDVFKNNLYTWHYEDFRKCGALKETQVTLENVSSSYDSGSKSVTVSNYPITKGNGLGELAELADITVFVNSVQVLVESVDSLRGIITLSSPAPIGALIEVSYYYSQNASYGMEHNVEGLVFNQNYDFSSVSSGNFSASLTSPLDTEVRKVKYKTEAFALNASSVFNLAYSLTHNTDQQYNEVFNHARVVKNYEEVSCKVNNINAGLGLTEDGVCLNYPTPPVQLRFSSEAPIPDPWKVLEGSDILNDPEELLNDNMVLNNLLRKAFYGPYDKKYTFINIDKEECGGTRVLYPFCDTADMNIDVGFSDEGLIIKPEEDCIHFNIDGDILNEDVFYSVEKTGCIFTVKLFEEDFVDPITDDSPLKVDFGLMFQDVYKGILNKMIFNDATTSITSVPILGFPSTGDLLNDPLYNLNTIGNNLNDESAITVDTEDIAEILIPPSRVFPGDGDDVVPPELKNSPLDTNYVFCAKETFDESVLFNTHVMFGDSYMFPTERYVLNNPPYGLNQTPFILNASDDMLAVVP
jgi:hypothetical protein